MRFPTQLFSFIAKIIKDITGQTNWYDVPVKKINQLDTEISAHIGMLGAEKVIAVIMFIE